MKLFSKVGCSPCKALKEWIVDFNIGGIEVVDITEAMQEVRALGVRSVPALSTGSGVIIGEEPIKNYLKGAK